jgi:hypothetical protein
MSRNIDRDEIMRIAAERARLKKEKEAREEKEFYERITSGKQWLLFKAVVVFCTAMVVITTIETFVDGPTKKLSKNDWKTDPNWEWTWHKVLDVKGYMFSPELKNWSGWDENSLKMTYSPIFRTGKKLSYNIKVDENVVRRHEELRERSIFDWFPLLQIALLIPLATFILKRQSPWFNFARITSLVFVFPATLLVIFFCLM